MPILYSSVRSRLVVMQIRMGDAITNECSFTQYTFAKYASLFYALCENPSTKE